MKVKKIMHEGVEWVSPDTLVTAVAKRMAKFDIGAIPVGENDRLVGMVTDRDIAVRGVADGKDLSKLTAGEIMTKGIVWCKAGDSADEATRIMEERKIRRLPVIDENKRMVGMLSLGDISQAVSERATAELAKAVSAHHK